MDTSFHASESFDPEKNVSIPEDIILSEHVEESVIFPDSLWLQ
jgi:hypothetical protein